mmetsp:Transcript_3075/g.6123  ORF Transcript_3075/g.6123 Transcript_3075/m.6123 type:complete len:181 (-) Transcript_3075:34-576(-)
MYQELSNGLLGFHNAIMIKTTPFPFPFAQLIALTIFVLMCSFPVVACKYIDDFASILFFTWIATFGYFMLAEVACEMEQPFGDDESDLPLVAYQLDFDRELSSLVHQVSFVPPKSCLNMARSMLSSHQNSYKVPHRFDNRTNLEHTAVDLVSNSKSVLQTSGEDTTVPPGWMRDGAETGD